MRPFLRRALRVIRRHRFEVDLAEEMEIHRAMKEEELRAGGMTASAAASAARRAMGNATLDANLWIPFAALPLVRLLRAPSHPDGCRPRLREPG